MYGRNDSGCAWAFCVYFVLILAYLLAYFYKNGWLFLYVIPSTALLFAVFAIWLFFAKKRAQEKLEVTISKFKSEIRALTKAHNLEIQSIRHEYEDKIKSLESDCRRKEIKLAVDYAEKKLVLEKRLHKLESLLSATTPFSDSAMIMADVKVWVYSEEENRMKNKSHPAFSSAEIVSRLKNKTREYIAAYKNMLYKYEFLLSTFPELKRYIDDDEALLNLKKEDSFNDFKESRDCCRDYLSDEEYNNLSEIGRNQLALDRYKNRPKSNWTIGMLYEMYIGYLLQSRYDVVQFGIINGVEDLGRDIIARRKVPNGKEKIYIIQCKNWSTTKEIHENVVCQIFGTAMEWSIKNGMNSEQEVIPVLCVTTGLSSTARIFAKRLGVEVYVKPMGDFPMIKCNINNGQKIYHLPFDQQYWRTKIEKVGEFYAWTVEEATNKGFRRALKHLNY